ncbi:hypothetical protein G5T42_00210 [Microbacterium sp. 4R-513]|uniref:hypothetical protein n=1 Tax=Microbacterium sp. 4R-513 TaxID=2567934 RepID=UPI0013E1FC66|nr:hypothetical protein [Microbacterium sp. 4R-513]QIG38099.1 hypothetical protein G5T42_00210 [Microbacterium sp. 4R-513]
MATSEIDDLRAEVERLRSENDSLRTTPVDPLPPATASAPPARRPGRWRAFVSALLIVIATILVPVSIVTAWARAELVDEEQFVNTLAPLADDPAVQNMLIDETMDAVNAQVDFTQLTSDVFDGIAQLGLPPRAEQALQTLQAPAAQGLENLVNTAVTRVVQSDQFADVWATATRAAHRALTAAATSDGGGIVVMTDDGVGIQLGAIVERVKENLVDRGIGVAQIIPAVDKVVIIGTGDTLVAIRTTYALASTLGWWLPVITLALFALGILIARKRSVAVVGTGIGFAVGGGALALAFAIGYPVIGQTAVQLDLSVAALDVIYGDMIGSMQQTAVIVALLGVFIAVLGWVMGGSTPAVRSRQFVGGLNSSARRSFAGMGLNTGAFGLWLARYRVPVRVVIAVLAVIWLYALRPLSAGDVFLVLIVAFAVAWILELLQKRPDELAAPTIDETLADAEAAAADAEAAAADAEASAAALQAWSDAGSADGVSDEELVAQTAGTSTLPGTASAPPSEGGGAEASVTAKKPRPTR